MKKIAIVIAAVFMCLMSFSQIKPAEFAKLLAYSADGVFTSYYVDTTGTYHDVVLLYKDTDKFNLYIDVTSGSSYNNVGFEVAQSDYNSFIGAMNEAKTKFDEWKLLAKSKRIKKLDKKMSIPCRVMGYFKDGGSIYKQLRVELDFEFKIIEHSGIVHYYLTVSTGVLRSYLDETIIVPGGFLNFWSSTEIQNFIDSITIAKLKNKTDIFK